MIRSILVAASGSDSDAPVFAAALAAARPQGAHLDFLHVRPSIGDAMVNTPHTDFAMGRASAAAMDRVTTEITRRSRAAERHFREFCAQHALPVLEAPQPGTQVSASWQEISGDALECMTFRARHHDLVVMGCMEDPDGLPNDLLELVLVRCGRPVLVVPASGNGPSGSAVVAWKESAEAARALAASLPLLKHAANVTLVAIEEDASASDATKEGLSAAARQLAWHGVKADTRFISAGRRNVADVLASAVTEHKAQLLVMGAYGHSRMRELIFGGCTQHFLHHAPVAVLLAH